MPQANGQSLSDLGTSPLALGALTYGSTVREMSNAYATFANDGQFREARLFTKVYDSDGNLVLDNTQQTRDILSEKTVNYMNYCLYNAANHGTGGAAIFPGQYIAGKTGTTSSNRDRWFCGYTTHYTAAVWCGYDEPEQINLTGNFGNPAARLWKMVMQPIHKGLDSEGLYNGNAFRSVGICLDSGKLATEACQADPRGGRVVYVNCYPEDVPTETCDKHVKMEYCVTGGGVATEYCRKFAEFEDVELGSKSLVRMTPEEIREIQQAMHHGLEEPYYMDSVIYLVDSNGEPIAWHGFSNNRNDGVDLPYIPCPIHTREAWETYNPGDIGEEGDTEGGYEPGVPDHNDHEDDNLHWNEDTGAWE